MTDLKQRVDEVLALQEKATLGEWDCSSALVLAMAKLLREQQAEIERLRKDAERYRWLRDGGNSHRLVQRHLHTGNSWLPEANDLDSKIDDAIEDERT